MRILSLDGGGVKIFYTLRLLKLIENDTGNDFSKCVDLYAGTSAGGLAALCMAYGYSATETEKLFIENKSLLFEPQKGLRRVWGYMKQIYDSKYTSENLRDLSLKVFRDATFQQLKPCVITAIDIKNPSNRLGTLKSLCRYTAPTPHIWKNYQQQNSLNHDLQRIEGIEKLTRDPGKSVIDVVLSTCAAPTYFPAHNGLVDGGVIANNPSQIAFMEYYRNFSHHKNLRLLSVGNLNYQPTEYTPLGTQSPRHSLATLMTVNSKHVTNMTQIQMYARNAELAKYGISDTGLYFRLEGSDEVTHALDDISKIPYYQDLAEKDFLGMKAQGKYQKFFE